MARARFTNTCGQLMIALAAIVALVGLRTGLAGASTEAITDYDAYPPAQAEGCSGDTALTGVAFASPQGTATDLRDLNVNAGDTVTMSWTGYAPGCEAVVVSLSANQSVSATFDMTVDQTLLPGHVSCAADCLSEFGNYRIAITAPDTSVCHYQIDAVLGAPLAVVGPNGSFYNSVLRNDDGANMLISAKNGANTCVEAAAVAAEDVVVLGERIETLPFTGSTNQTMALMASAMLATGTGLMVISRRLEIA